MINTTNSNSTVSGGIVISVKDEDITKAEDPTVTDEGNETETYCHRFKAEWSYDGWFSIQEGNQTIDIPASFGPTSWQARLIKFCLMVWFNATLIYRWYTRRETPLFFLSFLTHINLVLCSLWLIVSFINSLWPPAQPKCPSTRV